MRLIKMTGGLGNQMFIYAMYLDMKKRFSDTRIDLSDMMNYKVHYGYELHNVFDLPNDEFCINQKLKKVLEFLFFKTILERQQNKETLEAYKKSYFWPLVYFKGFYQDSRHFENVKDEVRAAFKFKEESANDESKKLISELVNDSLSVSLHVRRGDYLSERTWKSHGCVCQEGYYNRAVEKMLELVPGAHFYVFSEDVDWVKENINLPSATFVNCNKGNDSWQDMLLMSKCHHNIICNSTFSWWGAWLNNNDDKVVICPEHWKNHDGGKSRLLEPSWVKVKTDDED